MSYHVRTNFAPDGPGMFKEDGSVATFERPQDALVAVNEDLQDEPIWNNIGNWYRCCDNNGVVAWTLVVGG